MKFSKILCVSTTGMGNAVLYLPVIKSLKLNFPESRIDLLISSAPARDLIEGDASIDNLIFFDKGKMSPADYARLIFRLRKNKYNLYVTSFLDKSFKIALLGLLAGIPARAGFSNGWWKFFYTYRAGTAHRKHEVEYNLDLVRALGAERLDDGITLSVEKNHARTVWSKMLALGAENSGGLFGIVPGSGTALGKNGKRWPAGNFAELGDALSAKYGWRAVILGSKDEERLAEEVAAAMTHKPIIAAGKTSIKETAALIKMCKFLVSNDSGLMHVAAAVGVPVAAIFGPTLHWKNSPWKTKSAVVRLDLPCGPCYNYAAVKCGDMKCLTGISVAMVEKAVENLVRPS